MRSPTSPLLAALAVSLLAAAPAAAQTPAPKPAPVARKGKKDAQPAGPVATLLGFEAIPGGGSRIYVELTGSPTVTLHETPGQLVYLLEGVQIRASNTENALELFYHDTPALRARLKHGKKDAELTIQLKVDRKPTHRIVDAKNGVYRLEIDFPAGNFVPPDGATPPAPVAPTPAPSDKKNGKKAAAPAPRATTR